MIQVDEQQLQQYEEQMRMQQLAVQNQQIANHQQAIQEQQEQQGIIREQLDLGEDLQRIDYLLRGYSITSDDKGNQVWKAPEDEEMVILSDYGVNLVRNAMGWYINKNTLLSNYYEEEMILAKMKDFTDTLADNIFMEYEKVFHYPSLDACKQELMKRIKNKAQLRKFAAEIVGHEVNEEQISSELLKEMEPQLEKEISKIRATLMKNKLKRFELLMREVQDAVHSTYLRAFRGEERRTLRQNITITENKGLSVPQQEKGGIFGFMKK